MLFDDRSDRLKVAVLDFPASRGFMSDVPVYVAQEDLERLRARQSRVLTPSDKRPPVVARMLRAKSITSVAILPLIGANGPIGAMVLGSRKENSLARQIWICSLRLAVRYLWRSTMHWPTGGSAHREIIWKTNEYIWNRKSVPNTTSRIS
jgi:hypothetical protein